MLGFVAVFHAVAWAFDHDNGVGSGGAIFTRELTACQPRVSERIKMNMMNRRNFVRVIGGMAFTAGIAPRYGFGAEFCVFMKDFMGLFQDQVVGSDHATRALLGTTSHCLPFLEKGIVPKTGTSNC